MGSPATGQRKVAEVPFVVITRAVIDVRKNGFTASEGKKEIILVWEISPSIGDVDDEEKRIIEKKRRERERVRDRERENETDGYWQIDLYGRYKFECSSQMIDREEDARKGSRHL